MAGSSASNSASSSASTVPPPPPNGTTTNETTNVTLLIPRKKKKKRKNNVLQQQQQQQQQVIETKIITKKVKEIVIKTSYPQVLLPIPSLSLHLSYNIHPNSHGYQLTIENVFNQQALSSDEGVHNFTKLSYFRPHLYHSIIKLIHKKVHVIYSITIDQFITHLHPFSDNFLLICTRPNAPKVVKKVTEKIKKKVTDIKKKVTDNLNNLQHEEISFLHVLHLYHGIYIQSDIVLNGLLHSWTVSNNLLCILLCNGSVYMYHFNTQLQLFQLSYKCLHFQYILRSKEREIDICSMSLHPLTSQPVITLNNQEIYTYCIELQTWRKIFSRVNYDASSPDPPNFNMMKNSNNNDTISLKLSKSYSQAKLLLPYILKNQEKKNLYLDELIPYIAYLCVHNTHTEISLNCEKLKHIIDHHFLLYEEYSKIIHEILLIILNELKKSSKKVIQQLYHTYYIQLQQMK